MDSSGGYKAIPSEKEKIRREIADFLKSKDRLNTPQLKNRQLGIIQSIPTIGYSAANRIMEHFERQQPEFCVIECMISAPIPEFMRINQIGRQKAEILYDIFGDFNLEEYSKKVDIRRLQ